MSGSNYAVIGNELIQFQTAELLSTEPNVYRLSVLLRGQQGTEHQMDQHTVGTRFVYLDPLTLAGVILPSTYAGLTINFKCITNGQPIEDTDPTPIILTRLHSKPIAPVHVRGTRDGGNNLTITWDRRARKGVQWLDVEMMLDEAYERYEVDIMDGTDVVRTILVSDTPACEYPASSQITDFGSPQSSIVVRVYQMSALVGRGYVAERTL